MTVFEFISWFCIVLIIWKIFQYLKNFKKEEVLNWLHGTSTEEYLEKMCSMKKSKAQNAVIEFTNTLTNSIMISSPLSGEVMMNICQMLDAKKTIDIGVFTGYSALTVAENLPKDGKVYAMEYDPKMMKIAEEFWKRGGVEDKIVQMVGKAIDSLDKLIEAGHENSFDFCFIDADKSNYLNYYEKSLKLLRVGGVILVDNVLWRGAVCKPRFALSLISLATKFMGNDLKTVINFDKEAETMKNFNELVRKDERTRSFILPIDDGLYFIRKIK